MDLDATLLRIRKFIDKYEPTLEMLAGGQAVSVAKSEDDIKRDGQLVADVARVIAFVEKFEPLLEEIAAAKAASDAEATDGQYPPHHEPEAPAAG